MSTQPHQVVQNARYFIEHDADVLRTLWYFNAEQFLDCQHIAVFVTHHRDIIETVHITDGLVIRFGFGKLFGATMQQTYMRVSAFDNFPIHLQNKSQNTMRCRMLRTEVQCVITYLRHRPGPG